MNAPKIHIAGMLVHARIDAVATAMQVVCRHANVEVHATEIPGKFIAVLECNHERDLADCIEQVQGTPGVISVSMTSHYMEDASALAEDMPDDDYQA